MPTTDPRAILLTDERSAIVFGVHGTAVPEVIYWGAPLGNNAASIANELLRTAPPAVMNSSLDEPRRFTVLPTEREGWSGSAGTSGHLDGGHVAPRYVLQKIEQEPSSVSINLQDDELGASITLRYVLDGNGVLSVTARIERAADAAAIAYDLDALRLLLPLPARASEALDLSGRWSRERVPQRRSVIDGSHRRAIRRGRPGHDSPLLSMVGTPGFGFRHGEIWAMHVAWSGDQEYLVERLPEGAGSLSAVLGGGELLRAGEIRLLPGEVYETPTVVFVWSDAGIDGLSEKLHRHIRSFAQHPTSPRPLVLNTWEAVYFDHDLPTLHRLAERAAQVGVERLVLDDGWFLGRRNDHSSLGDWWIDPEVWPEGLLPLSTLVHDLGMEFGLWFEPEMLSLDSTVAREHPEWLLAPAAGPSGSWRQQHVLDLGNPEAWAFLLERISDVVSSTGVEFIKWDHNRDLHEAVSSNTGTPDAPAVHRQTLAFYALLDELLRRHPGLEIESCASGGARIDLGVLQRTHRLWASDTNDPIERQAIQRWTGALVPPELVGSHVGSEVSHTTHRATDLSMRLITALFGHAGLEWDLTTCSEAELAALTAWSALYRRLRPLLHSGITVRADLPGDDALLHGVVAADENSAVFAWTQLSSSSTSHSERVALPGLDPEKEYSVTVIHDLGDARRHQISDPTWLAAGPSTFSGRLLTGAGLPLPVLHPAQAMLLEVVAV